jgi:hypothetical protein
MSVFMMANRKVRKRPTRPDLQPPTVHVLYYDINCRRAHPCRVESSVSQDLIEAAGCRFYSEYKQWRRVEVPPLSWVRAAELRMDNPEFRMKTTA